MHICMRMLISIRVCASKCNLILPRHTHTYTHIYTVCTSTGNINVYEYLISPTLPFEGQIFIAYYNQDKMLTIYPWQILFHLLKPLQINSRN